MKNHEGAYGKLHLEFSCGPEGQTRLTGHHQLPPLQVIRAFDLEDGASLIHLQNISGGVLGGDRLETVIQVGPGASAQVTTTGATRVYRPRASDQIAVQTTDINVAEGGLLEYLPDPLIPYAGAKYRQRVRVVLAEGAGLFWWEILTPGRVAHGEVFAYELLELSMDLTVGDRLIARERARLQPHLRPMSSLVRLGRYSHFCTFYICRVGVPPALWGKLESELSAVAEECCHSVDTLWGVSALPRNGICLRGVSRTGRDFPAHLLTFWSTAKLALYGRKPLPPRKVY